MTGHLHLRSAKLSNTIAQNGHEGAGHEVCMHVYEYVHANVYVYVCVYVHIYIYIYVYAYTYICVLMYVCMIKATIGQAMKCVCM